VVIEGHEQRAEPVCAGYDRVPNSRRDRKMSETVLWELMEMEAVERYFLDRPEEGVRTERPGIIITTGMFRSPDAKNQEHFTVWFGQGIAHWNFKCLSHAQAKVKEILSTSRAKTPIFLRVRKRGDEP
jgi:hypothetical protein